LQTVRDWGLAFNAAGPDGPIERKKPGPRFKLDDAQRQALAAVIEEGPDLQRHGVVRWRLKDLAAWLFERFGISLDESRVGREVKRMGYATLSARPRHHQQALEALTAFKKTFPPA
jgi:transposase